jgi:protein-S-isoprenylcysteine O-methyltransferase Ste14
MSWNVLLGLLNGAILIVLSGIHFYWALGGKAGIEKTLPTNLEGKKMLNPKKIDSAMVAVFLFLFALLFFNKIGLLSISLPHLINRFGISVVSMIFLLRAMGDFRYVGFTKKIKTTGFAVLDTKFYSPLCLLIGIVGLFTGFLT